LTGRGSAFKELLTAVQSTPLAGPQTGCLTTIADIGWWRGIGGRAED
jgi:hypothetical protein